MGAVTQMRAGERTLFDGEVTLVRSKLNVVQTNALITDQRLVVAAGGIEVERAALASAKEGKHGLVPKMDFALKDGTNLALTAFDHARLKAASMILTGQAGMEALPKVPALDQVRNGTAWLAAFGPLLGGLLALVIASMLWGGPAGWGTRQVLYAFAMRVAFVYIFLRIDYQSLQKQGFNVKQLGVADPITFPMYLFSRAKAFRQGKAPAVVWCVLVVIDLLALLA
jgi:hypothetical protein